MHRYVYSCESLQFIGPELSSLRCGVPCFFDSKDPAEGCSREPLSGELSYQRALVVAASGGVFSSRFSIFLVRGQRIPRWPSSLPEMNLPCRAVDSPMSLFPGRPFGEKESHHVAVMGFFRRRDLQDLLFDT